MADEVYSEIAEAIGVTRKDVMNMDVRLSGYDSSLNAPVAEGESGTAERQDFLVDDSPLQDETVSEVIDAERRARWLRGALTCLNERELSILKARRLTDDQVTLESLGDRLGISKERVRQIESRALEKLKKALIAESPEMAAAG